LVAESLILEAHAFQLLLNLPLLLIQLVLPLLLRLNLLLLLIQLLPKKLLLIALALTQCGTGQTYTRIRLLGMSRNEANGKGKRQQIPLHSLRSPRQVATSVEFSRDPYL